MHSLIFVTLSSSVLCEIYSPMCLASIFFLFASSIVVTLLSFISVDDAAVSKSLMAALKTDDSPAR